jgi:type I restriction enzyme M protein
VNSLTLPNLLQATFLNDLHGDRALTVEDVVRAKARNFKGFDIVVTNPPFAGEIRERDLLDAYQLGTKSNRMERDVLFLERCVQLLKPGGRLAIVLPHNKVGGRNWSYARDWLLKRVRITTVLGLGRNTFLPHTAQKAAVLFGIKRQHVQRAIPDEKILFLVSERDGKDSKGRLIEKVGSDYSEPAWLRVNHDLCDLSDVVHKFQDEHQDSWEVA